MPRLLVLPLLLLLTACSTATRPYTSLDLKQVRSAYVAIRPIYVNFKAAYLRGDTVGILDGFRREQRACRVVDKVDNRDTINPNTNLFQASIGNDDMCNAIESAYVAWAKAHHYPYNKSVVPGDPEDVFLTSDLDLLKMQAYLRHPAAYA